MGGNHQEAFKDNVIGHGTRLRKNAALSLLIMDRTVGGRGEREDWKRIDQSSQLSSGGSELQCNLDSSSNGTRGGGARGGGGLGMALSDSNLHLTEVSWLILLIFEKVFIIVQST